MEVDSLPIPFLSRFAKGEHPIKCLRLQRRWTLLRNLTLTLLLIQRLLWAPCIWWRHNTVLKISSTWVHNLFCGLVPSTSPNLMLSTVIPIVKKQPQLNLRPLDQMVQMLLPNFGVGVLASFVYFILGMIFIQYNVSFKLPLWRFLCNFKYVCVLGSLCLLLQI
jgi:hypothetical protein